MKGRLNMSKKEENGLLFIWIVSAIATLGSLYFSEIRHYEPCKLCWIQRIFMYPIVIMTTVAFIQKNARIAVTTAVFSVVGGCISLYHYGIQKLSYLAENAPSCGAVSCTGRKTVFYLWNTVFSTEEDLCFIMKLLKIT